METAPSATTPTMGKESPAGFEPAVRPSKYRLSPERAKVILTTPPVNMTIFEAAEFLRVSPRVLRELIRTRKIRSTRVGSKHVLRRQTLDAFLGAEQTTGGSQ
jgi:excisionase family DNA binding protein